jgi:hypothetical protein
MAYIPTILYPSNAPDSSGATLYTVPGGKSTIVKNIVLTNTTVNEATISLSVVPSAGSASSSNQILSSYAVPAHGIASLDCSIVMPAGAALYGTNGTAGAIVVTISGVEIG